MRGLADFTGAATSGAASLRVRVFAGFLAAFRAGRFAVTAFRALVFFAGVRAVVFAARFAAAPGFADVVGIVQANCSMCHAAEPAQEGFRHAPKNVVLETESQIAHEARRIYLQAGVSHAMPPANLSFIEPQERQQIIDWFRAAGQSPAL